MVKGADQRAIWWRWAWRDLRQHAVQIASIGVVVAIGTGLFAGLSSTARWRTLSNDASFAVLHMHDLHVALQLGTFAPAGALAEAARSIDRADDVVALAERLVIDAQVDASDSSDTVLVGARIVACRLKLPWMSLSSRAKVWHAFVAMPVKLPWRARASI